MADKIKTKEQILEAFRKLHAEGQRIDLCRYEDYRALRRLCSEDSDLAAYANTLAEQGKSSRAQNLREEMAGIKAAAVEYSSDALMELHFLQLNGSWLEDPETRRRLIADLFPDSRVLEGLDHADLPGVCYLRLLEDRNIARGYRGVINGDSPYAIAFHEIAALQDPKTPAGSLTEKIRSAPEEMDLRDKAWCDELLDYLNHLSRRFNILNSDWQGGNRFCYSAKILKACREAGLDTSLWEREKELCASRRQLAKEIIRLSEDVKAYRDALCSTQENGGGFMLEGSYYLWCFTNCSIVDCVESAADGSRLPTYERKLLVHDELSECDILVTYSDALWELLESGRESWEAWKQGQEA